MIEASSFLPEDADTQAYRQDLATALENIQKVHDQLRDNGVPEDLETIKDVLLPDLESANQYQQAIVHFSPVQQSQ